MSALLPLLAMAGLTLFLTRSRLMDEVKVFLGARTSVPVLDCPQCLGFWVGYLGANATLLFQDPVLPLADFITVSLLWGFAVSYLSMLGDRG